MIDSFCNATKHPHESYITPQSGSVTPRPFPFQDFCAPEPHFFPAANNSSKPGPGGGGGGGSGSNKNPGPSFAALPNSTALGWAGNVTAPPAWPPLSSLRLLLSQEDQSCVEACQLARLVCEPAHFRFINNKEALRR